MVEKLVSALPGRKRRNANQRLMRAGRAQAEELERRYLLSLAGALAGPPTAITEVSAANLILTTTGSAAPSSATIYPLSDSTSPDMGRYGDGVHLTGPIRGRSPFDGGQLGRV